MWHLFEQTTPGNIGAVTVNHFDPDKDIFTFSAQLTTSVSYHDNAQGNAVITVDNSGDTITLCMPLSCIGATSIS